MKTRLPVRIFHNNHGYNERSLIFIDCNNEESRDDHIADCSTLFLDIMGLSVDLNANIC